MNEFLSSHDWRRRLVRTIVQGVAGVFIASIGLVVGFAVLDLTIRALVEAYQPHFREGRRIPGGVAGSPALSPIAQQLTT